MAEDILRTALKEKFKRTIFKLALTQTAAVIGEATKHPKFGTGKRLSDNDCFVSSSWTGENIMGKLQMEQKQEFFKDDNET